MGATIPAQPPQNSNILYDRSTSIRITLENILPEHMFLIGPLTYRHNCSNAIFRGVHIEARRDLRPSYTACQADLVSVSIKVLTFAKVTILQDFL